MKIDCFIYYIDTGEWLIVKDKTIVLTKEKKIRLIYFFMHYCMNPSYFILIQVHELGQSLIQIYFISIFAKTPLKMYLTTLLYCTEYINTHITQTFANPFLLFFIMIEVTLNWVCSSFINPKNEWTFLWFYTSIYLSISGYIVPRLCHSDVT